MQTRVVQFHKVTEVGLLIRHFQSSVFCGREELLLVETLTFLNFKILYMHKNIYNTLKERK